MKSFCAVLFVTVLGIFSAHAVTLAKDGQARAVIILDPSATETERFAAGQLASNLNLISGAVFVIQTNTTAPSHAIIVGQGEAAAHLFSDLSFAKLHDEEWIIRTKGNRLLLSGGRTRGTLYAVSRFLQDQCGVRWWAPWASTIPKQTTLNTKRLNIRAEPAFEYRAPFWHDAFDPTWSWENLCNSQFSDLTAQQGGSIEYEGFVHTFYHLVPPDKHFEKHPEWYSLVKGKRITANAQLCTTDP